MSRTGLQSGNVIKNLIVNREETDYPTYTFHVQKKISY